MSTRAKADIVKPRLNPTVLVTHVEPTTISQALAHTHPHAAMKEENDALLRNNSWTLVPLPLNRKTTGCK